jgi:hypothetical protein
MLRHSCPLGVPKLRTQICARSREGQPDHDRSRNRSRPTRDPAAAASPPITDLSATQDAPTGLRNEAQGCGVHAAALGLDVHPSNPTPTGLWSQTTAGGGFPNPLGVDRRRCSIIQRKGACPHRPVRPERFRIGGHVIVDQPHSPQPTAHSPWPHEGACPHRPVRPERFRIGGHVIADQPHSPQPTAHGLTKVPVPTDRSDPNASASADT